MSLTVNDTDAAQALDFEQFIRTITTGVLSGCAVNVGTNDLTVEVESGSVAVEGQRHDISLTDNVSLNSADPDYPRKDIVYIDSSGSIQTKAGTPEPADPSGAVREKANRPAPPILDSTAGVVIAEVWVPDGASDIQSADIRDRRIDFRDRLPDDYKVYFGDSQEFSIQYDSDTNQFVWTHEPSGMEITFNSVGDLDIPGDLSVGGSFQPTAVGPSDELQFPIYSDNANAVAEDAQVWFNNGSNQAAGIYYYDGGVVGPLETGAGSAPAALSGLNIDIDKDWGGYVIEGMGHDDVQVPQVRNLTVADFEGGTLPQDAVGDTADATVQSTVALEGSYSLEISPSSTGPSFVSFESGRSTLPQYGDSWETYHYLTDSDDTQSFVWACGGLTTGFGQTSVVCRVRADNDKLNIIQRLDGNNISSDSVNGGLSSYLNETLRVEHQVTEGGDYTATIYDSSDTQIESLSVSIDSRIPETGGIQYRADNPTVATTQYFDGPFLQRREPEARAETQKGSTQLGNQAHSTGGMYVGTREAPVNATRAVYNDAPFDTNIAQGTRIAHTLQQVGLDPAIYWEATADGQGGAYGTQLEAPAGRFLRKNVKLDWGDKTLADVPNWESGKSGGVYTFSVTGRPRYIRVEHDGSSTSDVEGQVVASPLVTVQSLGAFRITFHNIQFTDNTDQRFRIGIADTSESVDPQSGNAILYGNDVKDRFAVVDSGTPTDVGSFSDWSDGRTVSLEYDGSEARAYVDGDNTIGGNTLALSYSVNTDFSPVVHLRDQGSDTVSDAVEVEQITVEPLGGAI